MALGTGKRRTGTRLTLFGTSGFLLLFGLRPATGDATWLIETVDSEGSVGQYNSLALDADGNPHISYHDDTKADLKYACRDGSGWHVQRVDSTGKVGEYTSVAVAALGYPHISYATAFWNWEPVLRYARWDGGTWRIEVVDSIYQRVIGRHSSLVLDGADRPHICYEDRDHFTPTSRLKYARWDGEAWQYEVVEEGGSVGDHASLVLDELGRPHVSYHADGALRYASRDTATWQIETVDQPGSVDVEIGMYSSLALDGQGNPHIGYSESWFDNPPMVEKRVKYAYLEGSMWHIETVDGWDAAAAHPALALDEEDRPCVGYYYDSWQPSLRELRVAWHDGTAWSTTCVDSGAWGFWEGWVSLALDTSGSVHIGYRDDAAQELKYAFGTPLSRGMDPAGVLGAPCLQLQVQTPCYGRTPILLHLPHPAHVSLGVYDLLGRRVRMLQDGFLPGGSHRIAWDGLTGGGSRAAAGVYACSARAAHESASTRLVLLR
jgi:hypothetical protein